MSEVDVAAVEVYRGLHKAVENARKLKSAIAKPNRPNDTHDVLTLLTEGRFYMQEIASIFDEVVRDYRVPGRK